MGGLFGFLGGLGNLREAQGAMRGFQGTAGMYGSEASSALGTEMPILKGLAQHPMGYGALGLGAMRTQALQGTAAQTGAAQERARLAATRTGNMAALPGLQAGIAEQASRAGSNALNTIAMRNAELQQQQQREGLAGLSGIYGTAGRLGADYAGLSQQAMQDALKARTQMYGGAESMLTGALGAFGG